MFEFFERPSIHKGPPQLLDKVIKGHNVGIYVVSLHFERHELVIGILFFGGIGECASKVRLEFCP